MSETSKPASQLKSFGRVALCIALGIVLSVGLFIALLYAANVVIGMNISGAERAGLGYVDLMLVLIGAPLGFVLGLVASVVALYRSRRPVLSSTLAGAGIGVALGVMAFAVVAWHWCGPFGVLC